MPENIQIDTKTANEKSKGKLIFTYLPAYANYVKGHFIIPYIQEQINISRAINLPMLRFFEGIPDDQLITMSIESHREFLTYAAENRLQEQLEKSLERWIADGLETLKRDEVTAEDITLSTYMRKKALLKFIPSYTSDVAEAIEIVKEIDTLSVESDTTATNVYIRLLNDRIHNEAYFSERISNTTPGLNYIFNIEQNEVKFANKNYLEYLGCTFSDLQQGGADMMRRVMHPDDTEKHYEHLTKFSTAADKEVITWEYRLKNKEGEFRWMRNYAAAYKRNDEGNVTEIIGIVLDIDKEKETGDKLLRSEKQLLEAQAQAQVGSFELDAETGRLTGTPQFLEIYETDDFDLNKLIDRVHPADRERVNANRGQAINEGGIYDNQYRYLINGKEKVIWSRGVMSYVNGRKTLTGTVMDVTAHHQLVQSLMRSEELYKQAQELSHIGNWTCNLKTNEWTWSDELYRIYELEPQQQPMIQPAFTAKYRHPEDAAMVDEQMLRLRKDNIPCDYVFRIILDNGTTKYLHTKAEMSFDETGAPDTIFGTVQDVTEKQMLIEQLQNSEKLYKQAQAISHIGNWSWDLETKKLQWSDEVYHIYEIEPQSLDTSVTIGLLNHPDDEELVRTNIRTAVAAMGAFDFNYRVLLKNGTIKTLNAKGEVKPGENGSYRIYGTLQDITKQKQDEKQLKDYKEFIEKITDVTPSVIAAYNIHTGKYSFINNAIETLLGWPPARIVEEGAAFVSTLLHPDDIPYVMEKNTKALQHANKLPPHSNEPITEFKYRMLHKNGTYRWFHTYGTIFERDQDGLVESVLNISVDITDQETAEQALYQKNLQLQQSNTSLEEYAYVASHDLKEPLRKIATFSDRMLTTQAATLNDDGRGYLDKIIISSKRMQKMIGDLLSVSTILGNKAYEPSDLNVLLAEALQPLDHKVEESKAIIRSDKLPVISVVPSQFRQLFQNIINNSLKFAREGVPCQIHITSKFLTEQAVEHLNLSKAKNYLQIEIKDNGIGFDNQYADKIFAIFQRLHGKTEYEGTGIGLAVCKKIIENHGGVIFAKGIPNQHAIFTFIIPV